MVRTPWFKANPQFFDALKVEVSQTYPELHFSIENNTVFLRGSYKIKEADKVVDSFLVEIEFPPKYPKGLPLVFETGGRIPRTIDRHINPSGDACMYFPLELAEVLPEQASLTDFLNGPVKSFFVSQSYFEVTGKWLFGEWPHKEDAIYEFYAPILRTTDKATISRFFQVISKKEIKGHWLCPCGSGEILRYCHIDLVSKLHREYQYGMMQWGWRDRSKKSVKEK
jgi:hypothetical protein